MAPKINDLLTRNATSHIPNHTPFPLFSELDEVPKILIVTCADPRIIPQKIFGIQPGDAVIMRDIAGHPQPVLNDMIALDTFANFDEIMIVHHTDCGSTYWTDDGVKETLKTWLPGKEARIDGVQTYGATSKERGPAEAVRDDLKWLRGQGMVREKLLAKTRGFVYDVKTGKVDEVHA